MSFVQNNKGIMFSQFELVTSQIVEKQYFKSKSVRDIIKESVRSSTSQIAYFGFSYFVGDKKFLDEGKKLSLISKVFTKLIHAIRSRLSSKYGIKFKAAILKLEDAYKTFQCNERMLEEARKSHVIMVETELLNSTWMETLQNKIAALKMFQELEVRQGQGLAIFNEPDSEIVKQQELYIAKTKERDKLQEYVILRTLYQKKEKTNNLVQLFDEFILNEPSKEQIGIKLTSLELNLGLEKHLITESYLNEQIAKNRGALEDLDAKIKGSCKKREDTRSTIEQQIVETQSQIKGVEEEIKQLNEKIDALKVALKSDNFDKDILEILKKNSETTIDKEVHEGIFRARGSPPKRYTKTEQALSLLSEKSNFHFFTLFSKLLGKFNEAAQEDLMASYHVSKNEMKFRFKQPLKLWLNTKNGKGVQDPMGGVIFLLGEEKNELRFTFERSKLQFKEGFRMFVRTPQEVLNLISKVPFAKAEKWEWAKAFVFEMKVEESDKMSLSAGDKVLGMDIKRSRVKRVSDMVNNWDKGEIVDARATEEQYKLILKSKAAQ